MADLNLNANANSNGEEFSPEEIEAARVTAFALGQLREEELVAAESKLVGAGKEQLQQDVSDARRLAESISRLSAGDELPQPSGELRSLIAKRMEDSQHKLAPAAAKSQRRIRMRRMAWATIGVAACLLLGFMLLPAFQSSRKYAQQLESANALKQIGVGLQNYHDTYSAARGNLATIDWSQSVAEGSAVQDETKSMQGGAWVELGQSHGFPIRVGKEWEYRGYIEPVGTEQYVPIQENRFLLPREAPLSTFSIDVDTASYANVRRFLNGGRLPPPDAVRIEELVNYFRYAYPQPREGRPFSVNMEVAECPWSGVRGQGSGVRGEETEGKRHWLLRVGIQGREVPRGERPASNLVFLLDVSGSMADENKLPLLKTAMKMLAGELGEDDKVSIVTYAGEAGLKLGPTRGNEQRKISRVIDSLSSGGSTNGSAGIELAYEQAAAGFIEGGTNRVILCTDGDLNVGITSDEALTKLIKQKAKSGVFLTVLGFGEGNLKDGKMERLADHGNGLYAYIDSVREARKVLVEQLTGSTIAIAKDVKIQIEFNPAQVAAYRLLGYENRVMAAKDFNNDKKDAGEIGAGHAVTALYEIVPVGAAVELPAKGDGPLKYRREGETERRTDGETREGGVSEELLTLKLRYKEPEGDASKLLEFPLKERAVSFRSASEDFQFAASVASFGMVLRGSQYRGESNLAFVEEIAASSLGRDEGGYRAEFLDLVRKARGLGAR